MHILKIIHGYPLRYNAGSEVYSQSICNELSKNHRISIFSREEDPFRPDFALRTEDDAPMRTKYLVNMPRAKDGYRHPELDKMFGRLLDELQPEIAHIGHLNHLSTGLIDELHVRRIPIVFTLHDFWLMCPRGQFLQRNFGQGEMHGLCDGQENGKCANQCYKMHYSGRTEEEATDMAYWTDWVASRMQETRALCNKVDVFIAPSRYLKQRFVTEFGLPPDKVAYLDYGFPLEYLQTPKAKSTVEFTFGYIGTHIPAKGIFMLIEAFGQLSGKATLRIWGRHSPQNTDALKALAASKVSGDKQVEWMGEYINHNIAETVFSQCDAIVVPSIWGENSPLVIHEAQACKVPVITADFGGMAEYVQHQVNGLLFEHRNVQSLAQQLQWAMQHPQEMQALGYRGYLFSDDGTIPEITTHCNQLIQLYQKLAAEPVAYGQIEAEASGLHADPAPSLRLANPKTQNHLTNGK